MTGFSSWMSTNDRRVDGQGDGEMNARLIARGGPCMTATRREAGAGI